MFLSILASCALWACSRCTASHTKASALFDLLLLKMIIISGNMKPSKSEDPTVAESLVLSFHTQSFTKDLFSTMPGFYWNRMTFHLCFLFVSLFVCFSDFEFQIISTLNSVTDFFIAVIFRNSRTIKLSFLLFLPLTTGFL